MDVLLRVASVQDEPHAPEVIRHDAPHRDRLDVVRHVHRVNQHWGMDFVSDTLANGRGFRCLTIVDELSKHSPAIEVDFSLPARRVVEVLDRLKDDGQVPEVITVDNGPGFICRELDAWAHRSGVALRFIRPGKPMENAFVESFNGKFRDECLNESWFEDLHDARRRVEGYRVEYNDKRVESEVSFPFVAW